MAELLDVPTVVLEYLAEQSEIADPSCVKRYTERRATRLEHAQEIEGVSGLRDFAEVERGLEGWVDARAWTTSDGPKAILQRRGRVEVGAWGVAARGDDTVARVRDETAHPASPTPPG